MEVSPLRNLIRMRAVRHLVAMAVVLSLTLGSVSPAAAASNYRWAGQRSDADLYSGLDGYLRTSAITMADSTNNTVGPWFSMGPSNQWVQIGLYQGTAGTGTCPGATCIRSRTSVHMYGEWVDSCLSYGIGDLGVAPTANYPFYISYTGSTASSCGFAYQWAYRVGSYTNPPVLLRYMNVSLAGPQSFQEVQWNSVNETAPPTYHGLNASGGINDSYGLHLFKYSTGQWLLWSPANAPGTYVQTIGAPPSYFAMKNWSAFQTHN